LLPPHDVPAPACPVSLQVTPPPTVQACAPLSQAFESVQVALDV
jgi:hypothetical protein